MSELQAKPALQLRVLVLGSQGTGKKTLAHLWQSSSIASAVNQFAQVELRIQDGITRDMLDTFSSDSNLLSSLVFLLLYIQSDEESISYCRQYLQLLNSSLSAKQPKIFLLENSMDPSCQPTYSLSSKLLHLGMDGVQFPLLLANVTSPVQLHLVFEHIVLSPLLDPLPPAACQEILSQACSQGRSMVLKLMLGRGMDPQPLSWLELVFRSMEDCTCDDPQLLALLEIAEFAHNIAPQPSKQFALSRTGEYPRASLLALTRFSDPANKIPTQLLISRCDLASIPMSGVADAPFTHVSLERNKLTYVPKELFQLQKLSTLNLSHNLLEQIPSIMHWNCPRLQRLNLSSNCLTDAPLGLFKSNTLGANSTLFHDEDTHTGPQQRMIQLTGHNLYPCIFSVVWVNISRNHRLTRIPEWVCVLPKLVTLNMRDTPKVRKLSPQLAYWKKLAIIKIDSERFISPPAHVCAKGSTAIVAYLRCQLRGSMHYRHMKLMFLGESGSGKTTIFQRLVGRKTSSSSLHAMEVASYDYRSKSKGGQKITYHPIDFHGHSSVYQCFLTRRCLYLCVWNVSLGKRGLSALLPWLRTLHLCVPRATAILIGTHIDLLCPLDPEEIRKWQREVFHTDNLTKLRLADEASSLGLPRIAQVMLANARLSENIDNLKREIHAAVLEMQAPHSQEKWVEEMVPRSYIELQGLVETKVKHLHQKAGILTYEEFIDSFHSFSFRNWDLDEDEDEFALACEFLYNVGAIVRHSSSQPGLSDLFFLNPQWLSDTLVAILGTCKGKVEESAGTISRSLLLKVLQENQVPGQYQQEFISMMERHNLLVALDMDRKLFLVPSLLPLAQPSHYPQYLLSSSDITVQYISFNYLPEAFFSHLQSRILMYIHSLAAELASLIPDLDRSSFSPARPQNESGKISRAKMKKSFTVGRGGYIQRENAADEGEESLEVLAQRVRAISNVDPSSTAQRDSLHHKLMALFHPIKPLLPSFPNQAPPSSCWVATEDGLSRSILWKKGMYMQFLDHTEAWIELHKDSLAIITKGPLVHRIKALTFLRSSFDTICDERYPRLSQVAYSPCAQCLRRLDMEDDTFSFSVSSVDLESCAASEPSYSTCGPTATCPSDKDAGESSRWRSSVMAAFHNKCVSFFPLHSLILSLTKPQTDLLCSYCNIMANVSEVSPDTLLTDFSDTLLLSPELFEFTADESSRLGKGGYADVYSGRYDGKPVAVKLFKEKWRGGAMDPTTPFQSLRAELGILANISHAHVLSPRGVTLHPLSIVFNLAPLGSLRDHINLCPYGMSDQLCHDLLHQIVSGISYLHSLYIIHRDIKPSNVLVWSLDPKLGVHIKIADCGLSQFSTPSGLHRPKGTEDYMAPELFKSTRNSSYHEKIDIFSFGVVLYNVVTGKKLDPGFFRKQKVRGPSSSMPRLGRAIADAMQEQRPHGSHPSPAHLLLKDGVHPASRQGYVSNCVTTCMQKLLDDCLAILPDNRPTAEGISNRLCICTGPFRQEKIIIDHDYLLSWACLCRGSTFSSLVAWRKEDEKLMFITPGVWAVKQVPLLVKEANAVIVVDDQVIVSSRSTNKVYAFRASDMKTVAVSLHPLPSPITCLFSSRATRQIAVGMEGGWMAVFSSNNDDALVHHQLEGELKLIQVMDHPDPRKTILSCGLFSDETVLCAIGRCLVGLDATTLQQKFYKPLTDVRGPTVSELVATPSGHVWTRFAKSSEIAISDIATGNKVDSIELSSLLSRSYPSVIYSVSVSSITSQGSMVWVGTNTGQVIGFDSASLEVTMAVSQLQCVDALVALDDGMMVVFGRWAADERKSELMSGFSLWRSKFLTRTTPDQIS